MVPARSPGATTSLFSWPKGWASGLTSLFKILALNPLPPSKVKSSGDFSVVTFACFMSTLIIVSIVSSANRSPVLDVLRFLVRELSQVFIPLNRQQVLFLVIALLARRHEISLGALAAPYQGNDMVHG